MTSYKRASSPVRRFGVRLKFGAILASLKATLICAADKAISRRMLHKELTDGEPCAERACEGNDSCKLHYELAALLAILCTYRLLQIPGLDCHSRSGPSLQLSIVGQTILDSTT